MANSVIIDTNGQFDLSKSGICWSSIICGAAASLAVSIILFALGSGLGFLVASPWDDMSATATAVGIGTIIWLVLMQWFSAGFGGYFAGRLRGKRIGMHDDEVYFRDTAHGFLSWVFATLFTACFFASALWAVAGGGMLAGASMRAKTQDQNEHTAYYVDSLFRSDNADMKVTPDTRMETSRIIINGFKNGDVAVADREHLSRLVAANTGLPNDEAAKRVDEVIMTAKTSVDKARKAAAMFSIIMCIAMLTSAFIASMAGLKGGRHRDQY
jgi:hypothetical protein